MEKSLIDYLKQIPDHRDPHGLRHPLWLVLLIIIMGMMSGYWGYRQLGRFVERHRRELINIAILNRLWQNSILKKFGKIKYLTISKKLE
ncbi:MULTISPECIES: transposase family protein [unclassified Moorena]|uniref:transposase family protein n=1 Tax=unclassified Moorena TaxID=2683338 RepID=UPI00257CB7C3|nr:MULTISPECIES: transposase family protein [unclassified Moorena]